ncbi:anthranilate synthase component II [Balneola vulgaris]|uniref:anthranilate synthase component II n=1 Tax=Balneola vulgaris TaxID=287535 RepID=UPI000368848B|nr:aminodeoxychorismate/anthranilate synthase component II [Balneola vulgaris]
MVLIIDNYDSFTYNLVHLVAAQTDDYKVIRNDECTLDEIKEMKPSKILISPGPGRPSDAGISKKVIEELGKTTPILGVCLGHQAIGEVFGAKVDYAPNLMHGKVSQVEHDGKFIFKDVEPNCTATRYHSLVLAPNSIPDVLEITAKSGDVIMGVRHKEYPIQGIQFHPESILTTEGPKMITNWLLQS